MYAQAPAYGAPSRHSTYRSSYQQQQYGAPGRHSSVSSRYSYQAPSGPPPGTDPQLWQWFTAVDTDRSGAISVNELQSALLNGFDLDTVKMLMNIFDVDRSGTISFTEFAGLWKYISDWQNVFRHFDRDHSGSIDGQELADALSNFGYRLTPQLLQLIEQKYVSAPAEGYGPPPGITFDRFVRACVAVKTLTEAFQRADTDHDGWVQVNYEQFMSVSIEHMVLSCP
ncbi:hypothetical protein EV714DRAFT_284263 [Schizophyllum commune]